MRVENAYEQRLGEHSPTGAIFALKNFGWKDKTEAEVNTNGTLNVVVGLPKLDGGSSDDEPDEPNQVEPSEP